MHGHRWKNLEFEGNFLNRNWNKKSYFYEIYVKFCFPLIPLLSQEFLVKFSISHMFCKVSELTRGILLCLSLYPFVLPTLWCQKEVVSVILIHHFLWKEKSISIKKPSFMEFGWKKDIFYRWCFYIYLMFCFTYGYFEINIQVIYSSNNIYVSRINSNVIRFIISLLMLNLNC